MKHAVMIGFAILCAFVFSVAIGSATQSESDAEPDACIAEMKAAIAALEKQVTELRTQVDHNSEQLCNALPIAARSLAENVDQLATGASSDVDSLKLSEMAAQNRKSISATMLVVNTMQEWIMNHEVTHEAVQKRIDPDDETQRKNTESHIAIVEYIDDVRADLLKVRNFVAYHHPQ